MKLYHVTIGGAKEKDLIGFHHNSLAIKYVQHEKILVYSLAWHLLCMMPENVLHKRLFCL